MDFEGMKRALTPLVLLLNRVSSEFDVRLLARSVVPVFLIVAFPLVSDAASFDCKQAETKVEKLICSEHELSSADEEMGRRYRELLAEHQKDRVELVGQQRRWLKQVRNVCSDVNCLVTVYARRNFELQLEITRRAFLGRQLVAPTKTFNDEPLCEAFLEDVKTGQHMAPIAPVLEVMDLDDPRLGGRESVWVNGKMEYRDRDDPRVGRWHRCDGIEAYESAAEHLGFVFQGLDRQGGRPPYRFYKIDLDGDASNGLEDIVEYRSASDGYTQIYQWIDLQGCAVRNQFAETSPRALGPEYKDALSLVFQYKGAPMVLSYADLASVRDADTSSMPKIVLLDFLNAQLCTWKDPRLIPPD